MFIQLRGFLRRTSSTRIHFTRNLFLACACLCAAFPNATSACEIYTVSDGNSALSMDLSNQRNAFAWNVDGQKQLEQQSLWFRIGNTGGEAPIQTLGSTRITETADSLQAIYANSQMRVQVTYSLDGGDNGSGEANLTQQIIIQNLTRHALDLHFFQYTDWNLNGIVQLGQNAQGLFNEATVTSGDTSVTQSFIGANRGVAGIDMLCKLKDRLPTLLANQPGPSTNLTWTLEWDQVINGKGTFILSQVLSLDPIPVPEPPISAMVMFSAVACLWVCKLIDRG
jgi:hypothetical protein